MTTVLRAITVYPSVAAIEAERGSDTTKFAESVDRPVLFEWVPGDETARNGTSVLTHTGGTVGRWLQREFTAGVTHDLGADLTAGSQTLTWTALTSWRRIPAATLTTNATKTLAAIAAAAAGASFEITRFDISAYTVAIVNGGPGAGTLFTFPGGVQWAAKFHWDGTNWLLRSGGALEFIP